MSLHIVAYRKLIVLPEGTPPDDDWDTRIGLYDNSAFPGRSTGIDCSRVYRVADPSDRIDFEAGSYGGYGMWREQLARLAGYPVVNDDDALNVGAGLVSRVAATIGGRAMPQSAARWAWENPSLAADKPFFELINFADNEGTIGPVASQALLLDFSAWYDDARRYAPTTGGARDAEWFYAKYVDWHRAFLYAADGGAVKFT